MRPAAKEILRSIFIALRSHGSMPIVTLGLIVIALIWIIAVDRIRQDQRLAQHDMAVNAVNIAKAFEQTVGDAIAQLDALLLLFRDLHAQSEAPPWAALIKPSYIKNTVAIQLAVLDAKGIIIASTVNNFIPNKINVSDREHFQVHLHAKSDVLFISKPVRGRATGQQTIQLTRNFKESDGTFGGVLVASIDITLLTRSYGNLSLGNAGGVALLGTDDTFRAGTGSFKSVIGRGYRETQVLAEMKIERVSRGNDTQIVEKQISGGAIRFVNMRPVSGFPLIAMTAISSDMDPDLWNWSGWSYILSAMLGTVMIIAALSAALRAQSLSRRSLEQRNAMEIEKKVAESAANDRSLFLAVVSHEIRTPLNGVLGALDLIRGGSISDQTRRYVDMATESGESLLGLIEDILLFSKAENDKIDLAQEPFVLNHIVRSVHESFLPLVEKQHNNIALSICAEALRPVIGDARRIRQVLVNLVGNANKFTTDGRIIVSVEALPHEAGHLALRIRVSDTGIGIPQDKLKLVFNRFQTLDPSYSRRTDGTGLGLAICDKLIQAMGGEIRVDSEVGRGSCFSFDLIFAHADHQTARPDRVLASERSVGVPRPLRILLAEDNPTNAYVAMQFLTEAGHVVHHAVNGREAVAIAAVEEFDMILMDISMPEMDGIEATAAIRSSNTPNATTTILALTAHAVSGDQNKFLGAQMDGYLTKPIRKATLLNAINSQFGNTSTSASGRNQPTSHDPIIDMPKLIEFFLDRSIEQSVKILPIFVSELEQKANSLGEIIYAQDAGALQMLAHAAMGSGSMVGATCMVRLSRSIEARCMNKETIDWSAAAELLTTIRETIKAFEGLRSKETIESLMSQQAIRA